MQHLYSSLIPFDTTSSKSNLALIDYIADFLARRGIESTLVFNDDKVKAGLIARIGPAAEGGIILSGHSDVVPVMGQEWDSKPFEMEDKGDYLFGRGTADMKAFIACSLAMVDEYRRQNFSKPLYLVFSYDEEIGCLGALPLANKIHELGYKPDFAIVGEPTEMKVATFHKGINSVFTSITGVEGHSSNPEQGASAIFAAARLISFIESLQEEYKEHKDNRFFPPYSTLNVGTIEGGTARNIIPRSCCFAWELRPIPDVKFDDILTRFNEAAKSVSSEIKARGLELKGRKYSPLTGTGACCQWRLCERVDAGFGKQ